MGLKYYLNLTSTSEVKGVGSGIFWVFFSLYGHFPILYLWSLGKNEIIRYVLICKINLIYSDLQNKLFKKCVK